MPNKDINQNQGGKQSNRPSEDKTQSERDRQNQNQNESSSRGGSERSGTSSTNRRSEQNK